MATLTRNQVRFGGTGTEVQVLAEPTGAQRQAFDLIGAAIPLALTLPGHTPQSDGQTASQSHNRLPDFAELRANRITVSVHASRGLPSGNAPFT